MKCLPVEYRNVNALVIMARERGWDTDVKKCTHPREQYYLQAWSKDKLVGEAAITHDQAEKLK